MSEFHISMQIMQEIALFSGKIYTVGKNFTRPPVVTIATNLNLDSIVQVNCMVQVNSRVQVNSMVHVNSMVQGNCMVQVDCLRLIPTKYYKDLRTLTFPDPTPHPSPHIVIHVACFMVNSHQFQCYFCRFGLLFLQGRNTLFAKRAIPPSLT